MITWLGQEEDGGATPTPAPVRPIVIRRRVVYTPPGFIPPAPTPPPLVRPVERCCVGEGFASFDVQPLARQSFTRLGSLRVPGAYAGNRIRVLVTAPYALRVAGGQQSTLADVTLVLADGDDPGRALLTLTAPGIRQAGHMSGQAEYVVRQGFSRSLVLFGRTANGESQAGGQVSYLLFR